MEQMPPSIPDAQSASGKRDRILRAAVDIFARSGYFNARVTDVAKEAGVADGTIYLYFENKDDLLISIFRQHSENFLARLRKMLAGADDPEAKTRKLIHLHLELFGSDRALAIVSQVELRQSLKFMAQFSSEGVADYFSVIRSVIEEGQATGRFHANMNPQLAAKAVFGVLDEMVTSWVLSDREAVLVEQADAVGDLVLRALGSN